MSNMSYCRFENTDQDLRDCQENIEEETDEMSEYEFMARLRLINRCVEIALEFGHLVNRSVVEE